VLATAIASRIDAAENFTTQQAYWMIVGQAMVGVWGMDK